MILLLTNHEKQLWDAGMKLPSHFPFLPAEILPVLQNIETLVMRLTVQVNGDNSETLMYAMRPVIGALIDKRLLSHPDVDVNIAVACCISAVIRTVIGYNYKPYNNEQLKDFFELVVITLKKLSSASRGCYPEMTRVFELLSGGKFSVPVYDLQLHGLIVRLFTQFLTAANFNSAAVVLMMKKIMTVIIIKESKPLNTELAKLLVGHVRREKQMLSSGRLGRDVLKDCAAQLKPYLPDRMVNEFYNFLGETIPSTTDMSNLRKDATHKRKLDCLEGSSNMVHPIRRCQDANRHTGANKVNNSLKLDCEEEIGNTVNLQGIHSENERIHEKRTLSLFDDLLMPSKPVTELGQALPKIISTLQSDTAVVQGYKVKNSNAAILKAIFIKYGNIAAGCVCKTASVRSSLLKVVCKVVRRIQTSDVTTILSEFKEIERQVLDAEATNINVSWILAHMEAIQKRNEAMKKSTLLKEMKANMILVICAAEIDLRERGTELETAKISFEKAERYYQEVVTFFDVRNKKHKLLYDDGDEAFLHLEREQSDCLEPTVAINVSSPQSGITCVQSYKVKNINAPILKAIFKKHGDIASNCVFKTASVRESILEVVCDVVRKIKTNDVKTIVSEMEEIESQVSGAEANKINVSWLRAHLESIHKRNEALKKYSVHIKMKENTILVTRATKMDLNEKQIKLLTAQQRFEEAERCMKVLHLVEKKLNDDIFESKAEENKWVVKSII